MESNDGDVNDDSSTDKSSADDSSTTVVENPKEKEPIIDAKDES